MKNVKIIFIYFAIFFSFLSPSLSPSLKRERRCNACIPVAGPNGPVDVEFIVYDLYVTVVQYSTSTRSFDRTCFSFTPMALRYRVGFQGGLGISKIHVHTHARTQRKYQRYTYVRRYISRRKRLLFARTDCAFGGKKWFSPERYIYIYKRFFLTICRSLSCSARSSFLVSLGQSPEGVSFLHDRYVRRVLITKSEPFSYLSDLVFDFFLSL